MRAVKAQGFASGGEEAEFIGRNFHRGEADSDDKADFYGPDRQFEHQTGACVRAGYLGDYGEQQGKEIYLDGCGIEQRHHSYGNDAGCIQGSRQILRRHPFEF
ncbi:MAG: hypothetical protein LBQ10_09200 [Desulfovibrio sp.]|nr:hypothetical protein [Desulfovibrio sp.]